MENAPTLPRLKECEGNQDRLAVVPVKERFKEWFHFVEESELSGLTLKKWLKGLLETYVKQIIFSIKMVKEAVSGTTVFPSSVLLDRLLYLCKVLI
jgi:hypothetical protein